MFKAFKNRVLPFVCVFSILVSLCVVPASAEWDIAFDDPDMESVDQITASLLVPANFQIVLEKFGVSAGTSVGDFVWSMIDRVVLHPAENVGEVGLDVLHSLCSQYNFYFNRPIAETFAGQLVSGSQEAGNDCISLLFFGEVVSFVVKEWGTSGYYRIYCPELDAYVVSSNGRYAYTPIPTADVAGGNQWKDFEGIKKMVDANSAKVNPTVSNLLWLQDKLNKLPDTDCRVVAVSNKYFMICTDDGEMVYCDRNGYPYVNPYDEDMWAMLQGRPSSGATDGDGNEVEVDKDFDATINVEDGIINLPDGTVAFLNAVIYDESTKTYEIDASETYNTTNNYYFHYEYHINYTSITYIGQTEEYKKYEVSYLLPDGRDSADLTKEDLEQLNLSIDVIPYGRNVDDVSLRSLYHFDGDTRDASYWNYCTGFTWNEGASLTYMESGVFEGALYLDETEHDFTLRLPSDLGTGDFTLQYRIYQSHTLAPVTDSYISFGSIPLFQWSGGYFLDPDDTALHVTPTGTYNEIALIRDSGTIYYYLNGVCMGSYANTSALNDRITFHFGDQQETYKYFDELRVLNRALVEGGESYTPTSIPHDTNMELKVPTDAAPVADEYWLITPTEGALVAYDFSSGALPDSFTDNFARHTDKANIYAIGSVDLTVEPYANFTRFANTKGTGIKYAYNSGSCMNILFTPVGWKNAYTSYGVPGKTVTVSVVLSDGVIYSHTGVVGERSSVTIPNGEIGLDYAYPSSGSPTVSVAYIGVNANKSMDILYVEVVEGASSNITAEWIESITLIDKDSLKTPTLAVRTDLEITSHLIGGVRPSVPEKGMVWAMVENQRITSLQIYNGQAWEGVEGRIWTGSRWIPVGSYNVVTLQDMYDIVDATPNYEYIYSESGFWAWWQKSWNAFTERLFAALGNGQGVAGGLPADQLPAVPDDETTEENEGWSVIELLVVLRDGTWKVITGTVSTAFDGFTGFVSSVSNAGGFFEAYDSKNPDGIFGTTYGEGDLWTQ